MKLEELKQLLDNSTNPQDVFLEVYDETDDNYQNGLLDYEGVEAYLYAYNYMKDHNLIIQYSSLDQIYIEMMTIDVYAASAYPWRGRASAEHIIMLMEDEDIKKEDNQKIADMYYHVAFFYKLVCDQFQALEYFIKAYNVDKDEDLLYNIVLCKKCLNPNEEIIIEDKDLINEQIKELLEGKYIKTDPVENTMDFLELYDTVQEESLKEMMDGEVPLSYQEYWKIIRKHFKKYNIKWKSPDLMNPGLDFNNI